MYQPREPRGPYAFFGCIGYSVQKQGQGQGQGQGVPGFEQGRIHSNWNNHVVRTGRLSSSSPNMQQIPSSTSTVGGLRIDIRGLFSSSPGYVLVSADYAQIEMRILAAMSGDSGMVSICLFYCLLSILFSVLLSITICLFICLSCLHVVCIYHTIHSQIYNLYSAVLYYR